VSSPTIRVNGDDVALELCESSCGSEACTDGCGDQIACRVWVQRGREYTEPPVAMIVDAILGHVYSGPSPRPRVEAQSYELPSFEDLDLIGNVLGDRSFARRDTLDVFLHQVHVTPEDVPNDVAARAGKLLQYIPWFLDPQPRFVDVKSGFITRARELYPARTPKLPSEVAVAAREAFVHEVGIGRDLPSGGPC
jgi:hypothetical protein